MIRALVMTALLAALGACNDNATGKAWYQQGDATYDALRTASDACKARGGEFRVKRGGDPTVLGDYECAGAKGS